MMRVWVERGSSNYRVMYELTPGKPVRHRSADTKRQALVIAEQLARFIRGSGAPGQGSKRGAALPNDADAREKSLEDSEV